MEKKLKITNSKQFQTLVLELERNPTLARGFQRLSTPNTFKQDWEEITVKLNSVGPPMRDSDGWLKVWRDFKFKVKKKVSRVAEMKANGDERFKEIILHPLEESVANLIKSQKKSYTEDKVLQIQPTVMEIKTENLGEVKSEMIEQTVWEEELPSENHSADEEMKTESFCILEQMFLGDEDLPSTSINSVGIQNLANPDRRKRKRNRKNDERQHLLEKHNAMQEKVFNEIANTMLEMKNILNESSRHHQKLCEVEEKKLKIMQRRHEREEQLFESEMKLKMLEMKIKTKELEALEK